MSQPSKSEITAKVARAREARALGRKLRAGKPVAFPSWPGRCPAEIIRKALSERRPVLPSW